MSFGIDGTTIGAFEECVRVKNVETPTVAIAAPMTRPITNRVREGLWLWSRRIAVDDGVTTDAVGARMSRTVSGKMTGSGATLGGTLGVGFLNRSAGSVMVFAFPVGDRSIGGLAGASPEIAARFSFKVANSANRDSTTAGGFVTVAARSALGWRTPAVDSFTSLAEAEGAPSARGSASGSAELIVARKSAARFSSLTATGDGRLFAFSEPRLMVLVDLGSASDMANLPRHSATQIA